ncbi:unnamed protein product, partial [Effrenium voratum]
PSAHLHFFLRLSTQLVSRAAIMKLVLALLNVGYAAKLATIAPVNTSFLSHASGRGQVVDMPGMGQVYVMEEDGAKWALVMKLSRNDFCHGSPRWTDGQAFNPHKMLDDSLPNIQEYDAKSIAFHKLQGVTAIRLQTGTGTSEVHFERSDTPEKLITTNDAKMSKHGGFNTWNYWNSWKSTFGSDRNGNPAFMRADKFVADPSPECRTNPEAGPLGCGQKCVFCMQAGDGSGCPVAPGAPHPNDVSSGIGLSVEFCGGGRAGDCSTGGHWSGQHRTLVWAKFSGSHRIFKMDISGVGQVYAKKDDGGAMWALVMKLSKNDFCHGSPRWTDGQAFNPHKMLDGSMPNIQEYDAKSIAFHRLKGVTAIRLETSTGTSEVHFERSDTPEKLITTNNAKMSKHGGFNTWNYWNSWKSTFGSDRNGNPAFMRADKFVADPSPECRANPEAGPLGCGQKCVFCMQAGDGSGCPVAPGGPQHNDVSSGIGLSVEFCGGGRAGDCSTGGHWSGHHRTLVWAQFSGTPLMNIRGIGQVYMQKDDSGDMWVLVMKLSKNDFCHGSPRWTDGQAFNPDKMLDDSVPNFQEYDAKSIAFHKLPSVTAIRLQTSTGTSEVHFERSDTPEKLITTNNAKISRHGGFNTRSYWNSWKSTFGSDRDGAPAFMRADKFVADPAPESRTNPQAGPLGCGKACVFCMQAGDWQNDISAGIGLSAEICGGGRPADCSTGGHWAGQHSTLVWAKFGGCRALPGECAGSQHFADSCATVPLEVCGARFVEAGGVHYQCKVVAGNCVFSASSACYGGCTAK